MKRRWGILAAVVAVGVALDQVAKYLAHTRLKGASIVPLIEGLVDLRYSRNPGPFFDIGAQFSHTMRSFFFVGASLVAIVLIVGLLGKAQPGQRVLRWALMLLAAGAFGNLIDRLRWGEVIDFIHLHWRDDYQWATFNLADIFLFVGICLLLVELLRPSAANARSAPGSEVGS